MTDTFEIPDWAPRPVDGMRVLVAGASGGIGAALTQMLAAPGNATVGAHGRTWDGKHLPDGVLPLTAELKTDDDCRGLIDDFVVQAGGIDGLVVLVGGLQSPTHWSDMSGADWEADLQINLSVPFYLARAAFARMKGNSGGRIVLTGTESALHGGGSDSMAYGTAKRATECLVQGLARDGARHGILVNGLRMGMIASGYHERWQHKSSKDIEERISLIPLGRAGAPEEAAALITYLLSGWAGFLTGQMIPLTGGDWL